LRCRGAHGDGDDWCAAFLALDRDAPQRSAFRQALARLLAGGVGAGANGAGTFPEESAERLVAGPLSRLGQWWTALFMALTWPSLCAALCFLTVAETNGKYH
jgi:hypothetical protein